jgi:glucose-6-phosphate-specific signal transduction histidine kinase
MRARSDLAQIRSRGKASSSHPRTPPQAAPAVLVTNVTDKGCGLSHDKPKAKHGIAGTEADTLSLGCVFVLRRPQNGSSD